MKKVVDAFRDLREILDRTATVRVSETGVRSILALETTGEHIRDLDIVAIHKTLQRMAGTCKLSVSVRVGDGQLFLFEMEGVANEMDHARNECAAAEIDDRYALSAVLDVARAWTAPEINGVSRVGYAFPESLLDRLRGDTSAILTDWFGPNHRALVTVGGDTLNWRGEYLIVIGDAADDVIQSSLDKLQRALPSTLAERLATRAKNVYLNSAALELLPDQLHTTAHVASRDSQLRRLMQGKLVQSVLIALATQVQTVDGNYLLTFHGRKAVELSLATLRSVEDDVGETWYEAYDWAYGSQTSDKLSILRNLITLEPYESANANGTLFTQNVRSIYKSAKGHFDSWTLKSIEEYFTKRKEAAAYVQSRIDAVNNQIAGMAESLGKNLLVTVGFIVGTLLAKTIESKLISVVWLLTVAMVLYIVMVISIYYYAQKRTRDLTAADFDRWRSAAEQYLAPDDIEAIVGKSFSDRLSVFDSTYFSSLVAHGLIGLFGVIAAFGVATGKIPLTQPAGTSMAPSKPMTTSPAAAPAPPPRRKPIVSMPRRILPMRKP